MCDKCNKNNCGCNEKKFEYKVCNKCAPQTPCDCPVKDLSTNCSIYTGDDLSCSGIKKNTILTDVITQLDAYICTAINQLNASLNLVNIGTGAKIYKGLDNLGRREIRTVESTDSSLTITETDNTINLSVNFPSGVDQNNFVRQILINENDLPPNYDESDIALYILSTPSSERTISETDSKFNIIIFQASS